MADFKKELKNFESEVLSKKKQRIAEPVKAKLFENACPNDCPECNGQSYIRFDVPVGHKYFGKLFPCSKLPITSTKFDIDTGLVGKDRLHTFEEIEVRENVLEAVTAVVDLLKARKGLLLLFGGYGLGKTLLLKIAVSEVLKAKDYRYARYRLMPDLIEEMRATFIEDGNLREVEQAYAKFDLLCIDEWGVQRDTPFAEEKQFMLINSRYEAAIERGEEIMTIIATNLNLAELPARLVDRFKDGRCKMVNLTGKSFRPSQK